jgi:hypothetical protein
MQSAHGGHKTQPLPAVARPSLQGVAMVKNNQIKGPKTLQIKGFAKKNFENTEILF